MNKEILASAIREGTASWDVTIFNALALALQSALGSKAGDITRFEGGTEMETLCWGHITVVMDKPTGDTLPEGFSHPPFTAYFHLKHLEPEELSETSGCYNRSHIPHRHAIS